MFAFDNYNKLMMTYIKPILEFAKISIGHEDCKLYLSGTDVPMEVDSKQLIWPKNNGIYLETIGGVADEYELFDPFRREFHMLFLAFAVLSTINELYYEDEEDEDYDPIAFWETIFSSDDFPAYIQTYDGKDGSKTYQILERSSGYALAEGGHRDKKYALFLMCIDVLDGYGNAFDKKLAKDIFSNPEESIEKIERMYSSFHNKLKVLRKDNRNTLEFDSEEEDPILQMDGLDLDEDFTYTPFRNETDLGAKGYIEPYDDERFQTHYHVAEDKPEEIENDMNIMSIDEIIEPEPDRRIWDTESIKERYISEGLLLGDEEDMRMFR